MAKGVGKEGAAAGKLFGWAKTKLTGRAAEAVEELRALLPETAAGGTVINRNLTGTGAGIVGNRNTVDNR